MIDDQLALDGKKPRSRRSVSIPKVTGLLIITALIAFVLGGRYELPFTRSASDGLDVSSLQSLYDALSDKYDGALDANALIDGAKHGMAEAVGDPYTVYFNAAEADEFLNDVEGKFDGIGAELGRREEKLVIIGVVDGSPAQKAGLLSNDIIASVNDQNSIAWSVDEAVAKIRGEKGTTVKLSILSGSTEPREITITRETITDPSVKSEITPDNIGIMRVTRFGQSDTARLARQAAQLYKQANVKGVILDLRGNGGGYLGVSQELASLWLENKVIVTERKGDRVTDTLRSNSDAPLKGIPTIVLVNGGSASASEIVAGALSDNGAARLVGEKTFGKGVVQDVIKLGDGGSLKVTIAKWFTPNGKNISKEGITPGTIVKLTEADVTAGRDTQKDKALELLR